MAHKKSLIPIKVQVPAAFVLGIVFVALLVFRALKNEGDTDATVHAANYDVYATVESGIAYERMPVRKLGVLIQNFQDKSSVERYVSTPEQNPFLIPEDAFTRALSDMDNFDDETDTSSDMDYSRARELNSIVLTGTSKIGDRYLAIVDGMVLGEGDQIDGYTIVGVGEGILYLKNKRSTRIVRMKEGGIR